MELTLKTTTANDKLAQLKQQIFDGDLDALEVFATIKPLMDAVKSFEKDVKPYAITEAHKYDKGQTAFGYEIQVKTGRRLPEYTECEKYAQIKQQLDERKTLLDTALKSNETVYDSDGVEVPRVPVKYSAESLTLKKQ